MRMVMLGRNLERPGPGGAARRLRDRWSEYVVISTLAASIIHAAIFAVWPSWNLTRLGFERTTIELIQVNPIVSYGSPADPGLGEVAALPTREEFELVLEESGEGIDRDDEEGADRLRALVPQLVFPTGSETPSSLRSDQSLSLILDKLDAIKPDLASAPMTVAWPLIRNPTVLRLFLRQRYNPMYGIPGAHGFVSVAMWINERGSVEWAAVQESSGYEPLDDIALDAFNEVVAFAPARSRGAAVPVSVVISVPFTVPW